MPVRDVPEDREGDPIDGVSAKASSALVALSLALAGLAVVQAASYADGARDWVLFGAVSAVSTAAMIVLSWAALAYARAEFFYRAGAAGAFVAVAALIAARRKQTARAIVGSAQAAGGPR